jgi:predicted site-specific integrase-resolvase
MKEQDSAPRPVSERLIPVVAYVRMSTEHQQYSTENQLDRIKEYAARRGMEIVRVFADEGKSGLSVREFAGYDCRGGVRES